MIELGKEVVTDLAASSQREWLEANGIGGYASGTVSGAHTRRYHALLVAATRPPLGRTVLLSKFEETIIIDGARFELSTNQYPDTVHPRGYELLTRFRLDPFPIWSYIVDGIVIEKKVFMRHGENTTVVSYAIKKRARFDKRQVAFELRPLVAFRDHHHLRHEGGSFDCEIEDGEGNVSFAESAHEATLYLAHDARSVEKTGYWYRNFEYAIEHERGFDFTEDLFQPCVLTFDLSTPAVIIASTKRHNVADAFAFEQGEVKRRRTLVESASAKDAFAKQLSLAADHFIVRRDDGHTVLAGYHWFSDWGRDTMIALPGLTLATGRPQIAKSVIAEFAKYISEGMLPNRFPDESETPQYNTVDATLWYFEAIRAYVETTDDHEFVRDQLYQKLVEIVAWHVKGTRYGIGVDTDALLNAGEPGVQLTWMDAKVGDWIITPRHGKPVEIQALWYNALSIMAGLAKQFGDEKDAKLYREMAAAAKASFNGQFWNAEQNCLFDVVNDVKDASIRPNQIFAVSLPYSMLDEERSRAVVDKVEQELLTPVGLRSLGPRDPRYVPVYEGPPEVRDAAYHQGTVWAWLIGPFVDAYRKTNPDSAGTRRKVRGFLAAFQQHLSETMIGEISEIFDGGPPHCPRGAAAQAWSVAEVLRVLCPK